MKITSCIVISTANTISITGNNIASISGLVYRCSLLAAFASKAEVPFLFSVAV
ncbi:MAG: hypothetical protein GXO88_02685 [Chlorobi bacterium]|nr:hypothetical protein [Chlorobiota bacterium]